MLEQGLPLRGLRWGAVGVLEVDSGAFSNWAVLRPLVVMGVDDLRGSTGLGGVTAVSALPDWPDLPAALFVALGWLAALDILGFLGETGEESVSVALGCGRGLRRALSRANNDSLALALGLRAPSLVSTGLVSVATVLVSVVSIEIAGRGEASSTSSESICNWIIHVLLNKCTVDRTLMK